MSHPFCATEPCNYPHGWPSWNGKAIHIRAVIDRSVHHVQALGEAIHRWNDAVGARFLIVPDRGADTMTFHEGRALDPPFDKYPTASGLTYPLIRQVWVRSDLNISYHDMVNTYAHEIGHCFSLADHPRDDINSVMSYQVSGRWLMGPSKEDVDSIAQMHGLKDMRVRPENLNGIENVTGIWHWDRYNDRGWSIWFPSLNAFNTVKFLIPYEVYRVRAKAEGLLGLRMPLAVAPGTHRWVYL